MWKAVAYPTVFLVALASFLSSPALAVMPVNSDPSLISWYKLDETSGSIAADSSRGGHDGVLNGGAEWVAGQLGGALQLNGSNAYVSCGNEAGTGITDTLTLAAWINCDTFADWRGIITKGTDGAPYAMQIWGDGALRFSGNWDPVTGGTGSGVWNSTGLLPQAEWVHAAVVVGSGTLTFYINGISEQISIDLEFGTVDAPLILGCDFPGGDEYFDGAIDDVRIYNTMLAAEDIAAVMLGQPDEAASNADPDSGATDVLRDATLSWTPGEGAVAHDVYLGTSSEDVETATRANPLNVLVGQGQTAATYTHTQFLEFTQTYYWRVDEVAAASTIAKGEVWSFTVEPFTYVVENVTASAPITSEATEGPEKAVDGSGLSPDGQHSTDQTHMWRGVATPGEPVWIQFDFDNVYRLDTMRLWNYNMSFEFMVGLSLNNVTIEYAADANDWVTLGDFEFAQGPGSATYEGITVDLDGIAARSVRININSNYSTYDAYGLSEVRFYYIPTLACEPEPTDGAAGVDTDVVLSWHSGREAVSHDVYLDTNEATVADGTALTDSVTASTYNLDTLDLGTTYYWKINEVNEAMTPSVWEGDTWSFTTLEYIKIDDFEDYSADEDNQIFDFWIDGYGIGTNGSLMGHDDPPYVEQTVVRPGGRQSGPLYYDNAGSATFSEAELTFDPPQDWTAAGSQTLVLYFRGTLGNAPGQLYLKINGTKITYPDDEASLTVPLWNQLNTDLAALGDLAKNVQTLTIGTSAPGSGLVYIDDVRLYRVAPAMPEAPVDPGTANLAAYYAMENNLTDGSGHGLDGTPVMSPSYDSGPAGYGSALVLDGVASYAELPIGSLVSSLTDATFAMWANYSGRGNQWQRLFDFGSGTSQYFFICPARGEDGLLLFEMNGPNAGTNLVPAPLTLPSGWHHVAGVVDSTTMEMRLYLDGDLVGQGPTDTLPSDVGETTQNWLGRSQYTADAYFDGALDDFRIYDRALSTGEIRYLVGDR